MGDDKKYMIEFRAAELLFYIYFAIMLFAKGIGLYEGMTLYNACLVFSTLILVLKLCMDRYSIKEIVLIAVLVMTGFLVWRNSGRKGPLLYILLIIGMKDIPIKRAFKVGLVVWGTAFIMQILLVFTGVKEDIFVVHDKLGLGHIIRWSLGYPHPNVLHISYVILIAFILYVINLKGKKLVWATLLCFIGNIYVFMYSVSYTGLLLTTAYLVCNLYFNLRAERMRFENLLIEAIFPFCIFFSVILPLIIKEKWFRIINDILNTRYYMSRLCMQEGKWSLFGDSQSELAARTRFTLDCSYTDLLMYGGVIIFGLMCIGYLMLIHQYVKEKKNGELAIIIGLLIAGVSEPFLFNTAYKNLGFIFLGSYIFERMERTEKKNCFYINILPFGNRIIPMPCRLLAEVGQKLRAAVVKKKKKAILIGIAAGIAAGGIYGATVSLPDSVYVLKQGSDSYDKIVYLDTNNLPENFNSRILNYIDEKTPMYEFSGNIITLELVRGIISSGIIAGIVVAMLYIGICAIKISKYAEIKCENINGE